MRLLLLFLVLSAAGLSAQELTIELANGSDAEIRTKDQLLRLVSEHDVKDWTFTRQILIDQDQIPHSHPVLTLHTRHLGEDHHLLSTYIHEQFHWFGVEHSDRVEQAKAEFRRIYPEVPARRDGGARDDESTYLHLIVCDMEFQGMTRLIGEDAARDLMASITHYQWIYDKLLNDPRVREVNERFGLVVP